MSYLEKRGNTYYALLIIPKDVRKILGKSKFKVSLKESNEKKAELKSAPYVMLWKSQIANARGQGSELICEGVFWKPFWDQIKTINEYADIGMELNPDRQIQFEATQSRIYKKYGEEGLGVMQKVIDGEALISDTYYFSWQAGLKHSIKTNERKSKDVRLFIDYFPILNNIEHYALRTWFKSLEEERSFSTISRIKTNCYAFIEYVRDNSKLDLTIHFLGVLGSKSKITQEKESAESWIPFKPIDIVNMYERCWQRDRRNYGIDYDLLDLILLAAYSGARIEEICNIKVEDVIFDYELNEFTINICDSKTRAGIRNFPIHSKIMPVVKRLIANTKDGYLLTDQKPNSYGERSHSIKNRFCRLKASFDFSDLQVFHSIRKTFVTQLENHKFPEGAVADIVGHKKKTITYGLYSGGTDYALKKEGIELIKYPFSYSHI